MKKQEPILVKWLKTCHFTAPSAGATKLKDQYKIRFFKCRFCNQGPRQSSILKAEVHKTWLSLTLIKAELGLPNNVWRVNNEIWNIFGTSKPGLNNKKSVTILISTWTNPVQLSLNLVNIITSLNNERAANVSALDWAGPIWPLGAAVGFIFPAA